jgi:hypothetical protein
MLATEPFFTTLLGHRRIGRLITSVGRQWCATSSDEFELVGKWFPSDSRTGVAGYYEDSLCTDRGHCFRNGAHQEPLGSPAPLLDVMRHSVQNSRSKTLRRDQILRIADSCFEMFSIQELRRPRSIMHEVSVSFSDSTEAEVTEAISLALTWRRMLQGSARFVH